MSVPRHPRVFLALLAAWVSLGFLGLGPIAARNRESSTPREAFEHNLLAGACEEALRTRLPSRGPMTFGPAPRVETLGPAWYRLVSHFEAGGGRTAFACEATGSGDSYRVAALTLVQW